MSQRPRTTAAPRPWLRRLLVAGVLLAMVPALAWLIPLPERLAVPGSAVLRYRDGSIAHVSLSADQRWRIPQALEQVDPAYVAALLALEDQRFWWHPGVDPLAVLRAVGENLSHGRVVSGASTLTMQLIRLVEPRPRTLRAKLIESLRAVQLELRWSKAEILETYLSFTPFGRNIEGVEAAALSYFGHSADALSSAEIVTLLAVPQSPTLRYPRPANQQRLAQARLEIALALLEHAQLPVATAPGATHLETATTFLATAPAPAALRGLPRQLPHIASWLRTVPRPRDSAAHTTLDRGLQRLARRLVANQEATSARGGVDHIAAVLLDHDLGEIRALVGGFDFYDQTSGSQIPAFAVPRSTGSTLKPLIHAQAIDAGLALPETLLPDVPARHRRWRVRNYDGTHGGMVRMDQALSRSLNLPFVGLLRELGLPRLLATLRQAGIQRIHPDPNHYGLSAAIGGLELSPLDLALVMGSLARGGQATARHIWSGGSQIGGPRLVSEAAAWLTAEAMRLRDRPDFPHRRERTVVGRPIAWKTGTSFGHRDAWAVGFSGAITAVVWLGNLDHRGAAALVGGELAAPVLFDLLEAADASSAPPPKAPAALREIAVCALSGRPPGPACPERKTTLAPITQTPAACALHLEIEVDRHTGEAVGPGCRGQRETQAEVRVLLPAPLRRWLGSHSEPTRALPPLAAGCSSAQVLGARSGTSSSQQASTFRILAPLTGQRIRLIPDLPQARQALQLFATHPDPYAALSWFVDGEHLETAPADDAVWWVPSPGEHQIRVLDGRGHSRARQVAVDGTDPS